MKHTITTALLAVLLVGTAAAQQAQRVTIGDNLNYGFTYSLPRTALRTTVTARITTTVAGPFAPYAEKFLGLHDVALADRCQCEIVRIDMKGTAQPDATRTYHLSFSEKGALPTFYLTEDRCLWAVNRVPEVPAEEPVAEEPAAQGITYSPTDVMTPEILKAGSKSKQAELVAQEIFSLRESRSELIRGEADNTPNDGRQLQLMLDNLAAQEAALMSLFVGNTQVEVQQRTFTYCPEEAVEREVLFRFSSELGFVEADDMAGAPYYVSVSLLEDNRLPDMDEKARKKLEKGLAFCVPGKVHVTLFDARATLAEGNFQMAQFGHVEQLPQAQFTDKKKPCSALFTPDTGALRIFEQ